MKSKVILMKEPTFFLKINKGNEVMIDPKNNTEVLGNEIIVSGDIIDVHNSGEEKVGG